MKFSKIFALGMLAAGSCGLYADTLYLSNSYNTVPIGSTASSTSTTGGGALTGGTLNGVALPWIYCVQLTVTISVPGTYNQTVVDNNGVIDGEVYPAPHQIPNSNPNPTATAAADIAWLLTQYANAAQGSTTSDIDAQVALQAAIWNVEGFGVLDSRANTIETTDYNTDLNALNTANGGVDGSAGAGDVANFTWITPGAYGTNNYQGLVTGNVPDGGMTLMMLGGVLAGLETLRRRFSA